MKNLQQDLFLARQGRDLGIDRVKKNGSAWLSEVLGRLRSDLRSGEMLTGEDIRVRLLMGGLEPPHHHNAWGAVVRTAITEGILSPTGSHRPMKTPASHARQTPVYVVEAPGDN